MKDYVNKQQIEYLQAFQMIDWYPEEISEYIYTITKEAAVLYVNAAWGGCHHDGGAGTMMYGLKEFVRGYNLGCGRE
jgi:hypothetical protein